jgi:hypothetical protein
MPTVCRKRHPKDVKATFLSCLPGNSRVLVSEFVKVFLTSRPWAEVARYFLYISIQVLVWEENLAVS